MNLDPQTAEALVKCLNTVCSRKETEAIPLEIRPSTPSWSHMILALCFPVRNHPPLLYNGQKIEWHTVCREMLCNQLSRTRPGRNCRQDKRKRCFCIPDCVQRIRHHNCGAGRESRKLGNCLRVAGIHKQYCSRTTIPCRRKCLPRSFSPIQSR
jgi:hypothetical protein